MTIKNSFYLTSLAVASLVSCKSIHKIPVPLAIQNAIEIPVKKQALTEVQKQTWGHADLVKDSIPGMSVLQAYAFLEGKPSKEVIVSVNDSGVDLKHEDLKEVLWVNEKEIPGNGIDDDKNGFVDDVHGWNFLGDVYDENLELTRIVKLQSQKFKGKKEIDILEADKEEYATYLDYKKKFHEKLAAAVQAKEKYTNYSNMFKTAHASVVRLTGKEDYSINDVKALDSLSQVKLGSQKGLVLNVLGSGSTLKAEIKKIERPLNYFTNQVTKYYNLDFNPREVLGDNENDIEDVDYGNGNPMHMQDDEIHGTHVAGIILAQNGNDKGVDGVAKNVKLMTVRCVPNGDEYDKDVALGFKYAVDNGAKVINTSFGKGYSLHSKWVHEAIAYAAKHDVLIVNAAGNDATNIDEVITYPNDAPDMLNEISDNVITIGAMSSKYDENMLATFSNYGKVNVDIFAPGVQIYATTPNNTYEYLSGTSMAAPSTAGVASMIRSYFPKLSASQVKHILMNSGTLIDFKVLKPGSKELVSLSELCVSGRIVNAYNAVKMAAKMLE
ncbi:MAG: S8 family peptidase [Flavicella sp.]